MTYTLTEKAVGKLKRILRDDYNNSYENVLTYNSRKIEYPHPFKLMYAKDANKKNDTDDEYIGAWMTYLPKGSVALSSINPREGLSAATEYAEWYDLTPVLSNMTSADLSDWTLIFNLGSKIQTSSATSSETSSSSRFGWYSGNNPHAEELSTMALPVIIAHTKDGDVQQIVRSAITPGSGDAGPGMFAWDSASRTIGEGGCMVGRNFIRCPKQNAQRSDGMYQLMVNMGNRSLSVVQENEFPKAHTATQCWIPIYSISQGQISVDYRGTFAVPMWD